MKINIKNKEIVRGTLLLSATAMITKILGVLYKIPLSYILTDEGMGYFNSAYAVFGFFYIISSAGVPKAVTIMISEKDSEEKMQALFKYVLKIFTLAGAVLTGAFLILAPFLVDVLSAHKSIFSMISIAPTILFVSVSGVVRGYLNGKTRLMPIGVSQLIEAGAKLVLGLVFAFIGKERGFTLPLIAAFTIFGITLGSFFSCMYLLFSVKNKKTHDTTGQKYILDKSRTLSQFYKIAFPITLSSSILSLSSVADVGIIMKELLKSGYSEEIASAYYGNYTTLAIPMLNLVSALLMPICVAYLPKLTRLYNLRDDREFDKTLAGTLVSITCIALPILFAFYFYSFDVLDILYSTGASAFGAEFLRNLSFAVLLLPLLSMINTALEARGRINASVCSLLVGAVAKIALSIVLIRHSSLGVFGAPVATVLSYLMSLVISLCLLKKYGSRLKILKNITMILLVSFVCFSIPFYAIYSVFSGETSLLWTIICGLVSLFLYLTSLLIIYKKKNNLL